MIKPDTFSPALSPQENKFNKALSSAQVVAERSFGVCKVRWRSSLKQLDNRVENVSNVIITCFTLHNFCQLNGENYFDDDGILDELSENERRDRRRRSRNHDANPNSEKIRNAMKLYMDKNF